MSLNTDWDVDYYKTDYESDEHWELRRSFMVKHKDKFAEEELVCLAQVFTNVEFMGCRYPEETMRRVGLLSQEVAAEFRASRAGKLKRTFVGAQDAAGAKAKARSGANPQIQSNNSSNSKKSAPDYTKPVRFVSASTTADDDDDVPTTKTPSDYDNAKLPTHCKPVWFVGASAATETNDAADDARPSQPKIARPNNSDSRQPAAGSQQQQQQQRHNRQPNRGQPQVRLERQRTLPQHSGSFGGFILFDANDSDATKPPQYSNLLQTSASKQRRKVVAQLTTDGPSRHTCSVTLDDATIATATADTKPQAKTAAFEAAVQSLRRVCYTIRPKPTNGAETTAITTSAGRAGSAAQLAAGAADNFASNRLNASNVGFKMMQQLGWSGGGLGNDGDGRAEPVAIEMQLNRAGLGMSAATAANEQLNHRYMLDCLREYVRDVDNIHELVFSEDFTKEERAKLHQMAAKHALKSQSRNTPEGGRYLVLSKKIGLQQIATDVYNGGMYASRYTLELPDSDT